MLRDEAKIVIVVASVMMLIGSMSVFFLPFLSLFIDDEFKMAVSRAEQVDIDVVPVHDRPFGFITRAEATYWYNKTALSRDMPIYSDDICIFNDIQELSQDVLDSVILACRYRFFW